MLDVNYGNNNAAWTISDLDTLQAGIGQDIASTYAYRNGSMLVTVAYIDTITVSGNVYNFGTSTALTECDGNPYTKELRMWAYGDIYSATCNSSDGSFSFTSVEQPQTGKGMIVWIDDATAPETDGVLVIRYDGTGDSTGNIFYDDSVTVSTDDSNGVDIVNMSLYDYNDDPDIPYIAEDASPDTLVVNDNYTMYIPTGEIFAPNGNTTFDAINIAGTYTANTDESITVSGNWTNSGTFTNSTSTVTLDGISSTILNSGCSDVDTCTNQDFYNLIVNKTGGDSDDNVTLTNSHLKVSNKITLTDGELIQGAYNIRAEGGSAVEVTSLGKWTNLSTGGLTLGGEFANAGIATFQGNGQTCGDADSILISSIGSTLMSWTGLGTFNINDVNVSWQGGTATITAYSSTDGGDNGSNWNILTTCNDLTPEEPSMFNFEGVDVELLNID